MFGHTPCSLPLQGGVPLDARKVLERLAKSMGHAGFCIWPVLPVSRADPVAQ